MSPADSVEFPDKEHYVNYAEQSATRPKAVEKVEDSQDLRPVPHHLTITRLAPTQDPVPIDHEGRAPRNVPVFVEDVVGPDRLPVHVTEQRERKPPRFVECRVTEGAVAADCEERGAARGQRCGDLPQAAQLGRSDAAPVVTVKDEDDVTPAEVSEMDVSAARRG